MSNDKLTELEVEVEGLRAAVAEVKAIATIRVDALLKENAELVACLGSLATLANGAAEVSAERLQLAFT